ncbi:ATP-dependent RNA helicase DHX30 [Andrena cerasifolii]|uniref:ATP-dependent RNA helicase DHX30 n=1 Tax=Andrena cerasifolii TaxID=2819439 RepID=UPI0040382E0A
MFLSEVTCSLSKSVCSYLRLHHTNQLCRTYFRQISVHPAKSYCSYRKEFKTNKRPNRYLQLHLNENEEATDEADEFEKVYVQTKNERLISYDSKVSKDRSEKFLKDPVGNLLSIYKLVHNELNDKECINFIHEVDHKSFVKQHKCIINVSWPTEMSFKHIASNKKAATKNAASKCLQWLHANNKIKNLKPILYDKSEIQTFFKETTRINLDPEFKNEIESLVDTFNREIKPIVAISSTMAGVEGVSEQKQSNSYSAEREEAQIERRNSRLANRLQLQTRNNSDLPIHNYKEEILDSLEANRVLLIKGDTGCGKSTQVPQFIIDAFTEENKANKCNILVSQPRRISAISLANRVAHERYETVGDVVGYHVRLQNSIPRSRGSILFCTTGILLQRIQNNPTLNGVSHVIIDEAHERTLQIDMLLALLKRTLNVNPSLKIIIMSATVNVELFQHYFSCAVINVPGKVYPVKMHFLDDMGLFKGDPQSNNSYAGITIPYEKIVLLIQWIMRNKPPGAILCFLPGWQEIKCLQDMLERFRVPNKYIMPLHSKLSIEAQQKIFDPIPESDQKIILATDIAESSITIQDVNYVIDTVLKKEMQWNEEKYMYSLKTTWISQANICQRKGRAGRTRPGESYHFITKKDYSRLNVYPIPEIHRTSLEQAIILSKTYNSEKINDFFSNMLEKPSNVAISGALSSLQGLGILDEEENLTALGKRITNFSLDPKLSRALVFSSTFQCLNPILNIIVMFTTDNELAVTSLGNKSVMRKQKQQFHETSDHIATLEYFARLKNNDNNPMPTDNYKKKTSRIIKQICELHITELVESGILGTESDCDAVNTHTGNRELIRAVLYSATNQLIKLSSYGYKNGLFTRNANVLLSSNNEKVVLKTHSVNYNRKIWPSPFLTYIVGMEHIDRRSCMVPDTSIISPLTVLLFTQGGYECQKEQEPSSDESTDVIIKFDRLKNIQLCCDEETAGLLLELRSIVWNVVDYIIRYEGIDNAEENLKLVKPYREKLLFLLSKILNEAAKDIDISDKYVDRTESVFTK